MQGPMPLAGPCFPSSVVGQDFLGGGNIQKRNSETQSLALKGLVKLLVNFVFDEICKPAFSWQSLSTCNLYTCIEPSLIFISFGIQRKSYNQSGMQRESSETNHTIEGIRMLHKNGTDKPVFLYFAVFTAKVYVVCVVRSPLLHTFLLLSAI